MAMECGVAPNDFKCDCYKQYSWGSNATKGAFVCEVFFF